MTSPFYSPGGINVELNRLRTEVSAAPLIDGDADLIMDLAQDADGPVLELGCGDGRILFQLARAGLTVTGIDISQGMLASAERRLANEPAEVRKRVRLERADMRTFDLGQKFAFAFAAFRTFNFLPTAEDQRACLERVRAHLDVGAAFLVDVFDPVPEGLAPGASEGRFPRLAELHWHPETGGEVFVQVMSQETDIVGQLGREVWRFTERDAQGTIVRQEEEVLTMRWVYRWEMRYLLELCGFEVEAEYSDYLGAPPAQGREQIYVARAV